MCLKNSKPARTVPSKTVQIEQTDDWEPDLLQALGALLISSAQLEYEVYIVAKRKDGKGLLQWMLVHPDQVFGRYSCWLEKNYSNEKQLIAAITRARRLWNERNGYMHAI